jgi:hypothetical protein
MAMDGAALASFFLQFGFHVFCFLCVRVSWWLYSLPATLSRLLCGAGRAGRETALFISPVFARAG